VLKDKKVSNALI
jgi:two-component system sensor histidine kinase KdpD